MAFLKLRIPYHLLTGVLDGLLQQPGVPGQSLGEALFLLATRSPWGAEQGPSGKVASSLCPPGIKKDPAKAFVPRTVMIGGKVR